MSRLQKIINTGAMLALILLVLPCGGCFSAMQGALATGTPSTGEKLQAATLDVITLPVLVAATPFVAGSEIAHANENRKYRDAKARFETMKNQVRLDPDIVFREEWYKDRSNDGVMRWSVSSGQTPYTDEMLRRLFLESSDLPGSLRDSLFAHPGCSTEFLAENFPEALRRCQSGISYGRLECIVNNTNAPVELVKPIAESRTSGITVTSETRARLGLPPLR